MNKNKKYTNESKKNRKFYRRVGGVAVILLGLATINSIRGCSAISLIDNNTKSQSIINVTTTNNKINQTSENLLLINKNNKLPTNYIPNNLVKPSIRFGSVGAQYLRSDVARAIEDMFEAAKNDGIELIAISGYRSYDYQNTLYKNEVKNVGEKEANRFVAKPGESEHQSGLAVDISSNEYMALDEGFENTAAFAWLEKNMDKYGFIVRYPEGKEEITGYGYEPWHLRYVSSDVAEEIMQKGLTLEEFLNN